MKVLLSMMWTAVAVIFAVAVAVVTGIFNPQEHINIFYGVIKK
jgi:hypothetical protein